MSAPPSPPEPRRRPVTFRPRFTAMLVYLFAFFVLYSFLLAAPDLFEIIREAGSLSEQELLEREQEFRERGEAATFQALRGRFHLALGAAVITVGLCAWRQILPGMRP